MNNSLSRHDFGRGMFHFERGILHSEWSPFHFEKGTLDVEKAPFHFGEGTPSSIEAPENKEVAA